MYPTELANDACLPAALVPRAATDGPDASRHLPALQAATPRRPQTSCPRRGYPPHV